jgi:hypothetical protein
MSAPARLAPLPAGPPIGDGPGVAAHAAPVSFPFDGRVVAHAPVGSVPHVERAGHRGACFAIEEPTVTGMAVTRRGSVS